MKFKFIGQEPSDFMGFQWYPGTEHDVTDEHAVRKLSNSVLFEKLGTDDPKAKKPAKKPQTVTADGDNAHTA